MRQRTAIARLIHRRQAIGVVGRFRCGWSIARLSRFYGLTATGVQDLIRQYGFSK